MRARIQRNAMPSVRFNDIEDGEWFLDFGGTLAVKINGGDKSNALVFGSDGKPGLVDYVASSLSTPVTVTISYR